MERLKWLLLAVLGAGGLLFVGISISGKGMDLMATVLMLLGLLIGYLCACMAGRQGRKHKSDD